jgi:hypothetical protein
VVDAATIVTGLVGVAGIAGVAFNAAGQRKVERVRIAAEDARRVADRQEDQRVRRQDAYARYIVALDVLDTYATGYTPQKEEFETAVHEYNGAIGVLDLLAPADVRSAMGDVSVIYREISARMGHFAGLGRPGGRLMTVPEQHQGAYLERRDELLGAVEHVKDAMRSDLHGANPAS